MHITQLIMKPHHLRFVLLGALAATLSTAAPAASAAIRPVVPHAGKLELAPCKIRDLENNPRDMRCGTYYVFENRNTRKGRILPLKVVVVPARSGRPLGAIFALAGGPGEAATDAAQWVPFSWESENHDVVLVDMRGTGTGHSLDCTVWAPGEPLQNFFRTRVDRLLGCQQELRKVADLSQYSTPSFLQDVDEVRAALGYDKIILRGGSYGSRAAMAYIKMFGPHVRMAILSGLAPFENRLDLYTPQDSQTALDGLFADCAAEPTCRTAYPDPAGDLAEVRKRLQRRPARVAVKLPTRGAAEEVVLTERWFSRLLAERLHGLEESRKIPWLLQRARAGDFTDLAQERLADTELGKARGLRAAVLCNEDVARIGIEELERETSRAFTDLGMYDSLYLCAKWATTDLPPNYFSPFRSDVPTLMFSGDRDPLTAPRWGEVARRTLPNSVHVVVPAAHRFPRHPCMGNIGQQFLKSGRVEGLDTSCVASMRRPPFFVQGAATGQPKAE